MAVIEIKEGNFDYWILRKDMCSNAEKNILDIMWASRKIQHESHDELTLKLCCVAKR